MWCVMMSASESPEYFLTGPTHTSGVSVSMPVPSFINSLSSVAEPHIKNKIQCKVGDQRFTYYCGT